MSLPACQKTSPSFGHWFNLCDSYILEPRRSSSSVVCFLCRYRTSTALTTAEEVEINLSLSLMDIVHPLLQTTIVLNYIGGGVGTLPNAETLPNVGTLPSGSAFFRDFSSL